MKLEAIHKTPLFNSLSIDELEELLSHFDNELFQRNSYIFYEGEIATRLYLMIEGKVELIKREIDGNTVIINTFLPYDMFAESVALVNATLIYSAMAVEDTQVLSIDGKKFKELILNYPQVLLNLNNILVNKNIFLNFKIMILSKKTIRNKILEVINFFSYTTQSNKIKSPYNKTKLADFIGVNRSALERELTKMKDENILEYHKGYFHLLDNYPDY